MNTEDLGKSRILNLLFKPAGKLMGSKVRRWLMNPMKTLQGASILPGQTVLEVGCGTGFFTIPAARIIGDEGCLMALDALAGYTEQVSQKVASAGLKNVQVFQRDALNTRLGPGTVDAVLLFGVLPWPALPLSRLLPEMHRVLKPEGSLSVWLFPPVVHSWVPKSIPRSGFFTFIDKRNGVYNFRRC